MSIARGEVEDLEKHLSEQVRRNSVEPIIGHLKQEGLMDRCHHKGQVGQRWEDSQLPANRLMKGLTEVFSAIFGAFNDFLLLLVIGFFLAWHPGIYKRGYLLLIPGSRRERMGDVLKASGHAMGRSGG